MSEELSSNKNPRIRAVLALATSAARAATGRFALEGAREISRALASGYTVEDLFICAAAMSDAARACVAQIQAMSSGDCRPQATAVSPGLFAKLAMREGSDGIVAVLRQKSHRLTDLRLRPMPLLLAIQGVEKPGNLGALLRSADGAGADAVVLLDRHLDLYNPNALRASVGAAFHVPVASSDSASFRAFCHATGVKIVAAALNPRSVAYTAVDMRLPVAILLGEEAQGLSPDWLDAATGAGELVKIPMHGIADSLNVSVAGALLLYEARRQRS